MRGAVAACGLAESMDLPASVAPFILRGVTLYGIDSVMCPMQKRLAAWQRLEYSERRLAEARAADRVARERADEAAVASAVLLLAHGRLHVPLRGDRHAVRGDGARRRDPRRGVDARPDAVGELDCGGSRSSIS